MGCWKRWALAAAFGLGSGGATDGGATDGGDDAVATDAAGDLGQGTDAAQDQGAGGAGDADLPDGAGGAGGMPECVAEVCDGADQDCDGTADEDLTQPCYTGPAGTRGVGRCTAGMQACADGVFGACAEEVVPTEETCDETDEDCDGEVDEEACAPLPVVMHCGDAVVDLAALLDDPELALAAGCEPTDETVTLVISRGDGVPEVLDGGALRTLLNRGGNVVTEGSLSTDIYNAVFATEVEPGELQGACRGQINPVWRPDTDDRFWRVFGHEPRALEFASGCGRDISDLPGITVLGGWNAEAVSLGYTQFGRGRLWLVEADWSTADPLEATSARMLRAMLRWRPKRRAVGVQVGLLPADLEARGFRECYRGDYAQTTDLQPVIDRCAGTDVALACRRPGDPRLLVAEGAWTDALRGTPPNNVTRRGNDVEWYFSARRSIGFAPRGATVMRQSCDVQARDDPRRLCWHTQENQLNPGFRCGAGDSFQPDTTRLIYTRGDPDPVHRVELGEHRGFGAAGECEGFNGCIDAEACANQACDHLGHGPALSWQEGRCTELSAQNPGFACDLFDGDGLDATWRPEGCGLSVAYDVVCERDESLSFSGVRTQVPIEEIEVGGFTECWRGLYRERAALDEVLQACGRETMLLGCLRTGADRLQVAAMGERAEVLREVGRQFDDSHVHNGVQWYFTPSWSWGFAPAEAPISRNSCDTRPEEGELRLCWHTGIQAELTPGYRCGTDLDLNVSPDFERIIFHREGGL